MGFTGELAALTTAVLWSATAVFFTFAGRQIGSVIVNRVRLVVALILLMITHWVLRGQPLPVSAEPERWLWLGLSGIVGLVLGDSFLFQSYLWVGPRLGMLMMSLAPVLAALLALTFLGEKLAALQWLGILLAVGGVAAVVSDRRGGSQRAVREPNYGRGVLFGIGAATGQAVGLVLAKQGLGGGFPALSGNVMRMSSAVLFFWLITIGAGQAGNTLRRLRATRGAWLSIVGGATTGPFLGVWLSLIAIQLTSVGIASTLMALSPVFLLPIGRFLFGERIGPLAIGGTLVAIAGVGILFLT